jgi:hypothetical protein
VEDVNVSNRRCIQHSVKVFRVQLPDKNPYYDLSDEAAQSRAQKFRDKQCEWLFLYIVV